MKRPIVDPHKKPIKKASTSLDLQPTQTTVGHVFVFGSGDCAQLGLGPDVFDKPRPAKLAYFDDLEIVKVEAGGLHTLALSKTGKVYSWGCNDQRALGRSGEETEPLPVESLEDIFIVSISCGDSCSVALSKDGLVYAWGTFRGTNGIFGFGPGTEIQPVPKLIPELKQIIQISAGTNHIVAFSKDGKIFTWGIGEQGQLGRKVMTRNVLDASLLPRTINFRPYRKTAKFLKVFSAGYHTMLVHESNSVFSFGLNNYGQLGLGDLEEHDIPDLVEGILHFMSGLPNDCPIKVISGGEHFSTILTENGELFVCGRNDSGQLGLPITEHKEHCSTATKLDSVPPINHISCGSAFTLAISDSNDLWAWGYGEMGQLANENEDAPIPFKIELKGRQVLDVAAGGQHSVILLAPKE